MYGAGSPQPAVYLGHVIQPLEFPLLYREDNHKRACRLTANMFALIAKEIAQSSVPVTVEPALDNLALWERAKYFKVL